MQKRNRDSRWNNANSRLKTSYQDSKAHIYYKLRKESQSRPPKFCTEIYRMCNPIHLNVTAFDLL